jgi:benzoyl-CoA reductase/2-hydroxyglutaryl-CoA dehydratase subunit BcrC/BadD/HgdB
MAGVPPIVDDLFGFLESAGARIVYNEIPSEFAMLHARNQPLGEMYAAYTYPYDHEYRISRLREEVTASGARGVILYLQSFCHRQIGARLVREGLGWPVLALECDRPGTLDASARTRIEGFLEMLRNREGKS